MATGTAANRCRDKGDDDGPGPQEQPPIRPPRSTRQPHRVGYDCEFVERPPKAFQCDCPVCLLVLREPHQVTCCGYSFCATCVKRVQEDKKPCPTCNEADFTVFPDKRLKRSLNEYRVYCCQRGEGCNWVGELGELDRHLNLQPPPEKLLVGCHFSEVDCTHCVQPFQRRYVQAHQSDDCPKRPFACQHCNMYAATFEDVTQNHWPVCPFFPLSCPNNCELVLQRQEVEHHVSQDCPLTLVLCDFHVVCCQARLTRRDMPFHISENLTGHMSLLQAHTMTHPGENMATYLWLMVGSIQKVVLENANIRSDLHKAQERLQESQEAVAQLECTIIAQNETIATHAKELKASQERVAQLQQKTQIQEATLNQHQKTLEKVTYTGTLPFEFTMTEFEKHKKAGDEWYSPPFYTHTHGYRMCIRVDANGWKEGMKTHLSAYSYLMQGDFDNDLPWPFQGVITVQLLNQLEDSKHCVHNFNFNETTLSSTISRVMSGKRAVKGCGNAKFIPHPLLGLNTNGNCQFLKDNQLKFRVSKATSLDPTAHIHKRCVALESFAGAIEPQVCVAPIEFTLSDFDWQKKHSNLWYSPAFYTHPRGYRMCLLMYPNGRADGLGTHVSIFTCIKRGPFDADLKWPFRGDVTIQIVNQAGEDNHQERVIPYTDQTPDSSAGRVTDKERSVAWGFDDFLPHSSLGYNAAKKTQYLRGDSLRIRISKATLNK